MKRTRQEANLKEVKRIWPVFNWKRCMKCGRAYRREWLWRMYSHRITWSQWSLGPRELNLCRRCAKTRSQARAYFDANWPPKPPEGGTGEPPTRHPTVVSVGVNGVVSDMTHPLAIDWPENEKIKENQPGESMDRCWICNRRLWPWQHRGRNQGCHYLCSLAWDRGRKSHEDFAQTECGLARVKTPTQLYRERMESESRETARVMGDYLPPDEPGEKPVRPPMSIHVHPYFG